MNNICKTSALLAFLLNTIVTYLGIFLLDRSNGYIFINFILVACFIFEPIILITEILYLFCDCKFKVSGEREEVGGDCQGCFAIFLLLTNSIIGIITIGTWIILGVFSLIFFMAQQNSSFLNIWNNEVILFCIWSISKSFTMLLSAAVMQFIIESNKKIDMKEILV